MAKGKPEIGLFVKEVRETIRSAARTSADEVGEILWHRGGIYCAVCGKELNIRVKVRGDYFCRMECVYEFNESDLMAADTGDSKSADSSKTEEIDDV